MAPVRSPEIGIISQRCSTKAAEKRGISAWISKAKIDYLYDLARHNGALGGKITGAGSGGFLLLYCVPDRQEEVRAALTEEGVADMTLVFVTEGRRLWSTFRSSTPMATEAGTQLFV
jgi:galactokinase/mevalonate kinase-like predicted kinase